MRYNVNRTYVAQYKRKNENSYNDIEMFHVIDRNLKDNGHVYEYALPESFLTGLVDSKMRNVDRDIGSGSGATYESNIDIGKSYSLVEILRMFNKTLAEQYGLLSEGQIVKDLRRYLKGYGDYIGFETAKKILDFVRDYRQQLGFDGTSFIKYVDSDETISKSEQINLKK